MKIAFIDSDHVILARDKVVELWHAEKTKRIWQREFKGLKAMVLAGTNVAISHDGGLVLHQVSDGEPTLTLSQESPDVLATGLSGQIVASAKGQEIGVQYLESGTTRSFRTSVPVQTMVFTPDGTRLLSFGKPGTGHTQQMIWDPDLAMPILSSDGAPALQAEFHADGCLLYPSVKDLLFVCSIAPAQRSAFSFPWPIGERARFDPQGRQIAVTREGQLINFDLEAGKEQVVGTDEHGAGFAFSSDGSKLLILGTHPRLWDCTKGTISKTWDSEVLAASFAGMDRVHLLTGSGLETWTLGGSPRLDRTLEISVGQERPVFDDSGRWLFCGGDLWDLDAGSQRRIEGIKGRPIAFGTHGKLLATAVHDKDVWLWDLTQGTKIRELLAHEAPITSAAFSPDNQLLAVSASDTSLMTWQTVDGAERIREEDVGLGVQFAKDGTLLVWTKTGVKKITCPPLKK